MESDDTTQTYCAPTINAGVNDQIQCKLTTFMHFSAFVS